MIKRKNCYSNEPVNRKRDSYAFPKLLFLVFAVIMTVTAARYITEEYGSGKDLEDVAAMAYSEYGSETSDTEGKAYA